MINSDLYLEKLKEILDLQNKILDIVKKSEIIPKNYFELKNKLVAQLVILIFDKENKKIIELREKIIEIEEKIIKESKKQFELSKLQILQHEKSTQNMVNYFKSQIEAQSEIDFKA